MKCWLQIYVIYFLIPFKMKQIVLLFFTFSGISASHAQDSANRPVPDKEKYFAKLYPNPTRNKVEIEVKGFEQGFLQLRFYDARGNILREEKRLLLSGNEMVIVMFSLQPGLYMLLLKQNKRMLKKSLVVR